MTATCDISPVAAGVAVLLGDLTGIHPDPAPLAGTAASPGWLADPHGLYARARTPDFGTWMAHAARAGGCARPVRLVGSTLTIEAATGRVLDSFDTARVPDGVLYKACGNRRETVCPACSRTYRYDAYQLVKAGLAGGKGVPESVAQHPAVFVTLVAPSFGLVHTGPSHQHAARFRCRPRRDHPRCVHGRPAYCFAQHHHTEHLLGRPLCLDCYDHDHQVVFNLYAPRLWDRTMTRLRALLKAHGRRFGAKVAVRYAKVAEMQRRGVVHYHAVMRLDGVDPTDPAAIVTPPAGFGVDLFTTLIERAAAETRLRTPAHPDRPDGWPLAWGAPLRGKHADVRVIRRGLGDGQITKQHVAGYMAKYATKSTEATGHVSRRLTGSTVDLYADPDTHPGRLVDACWRLGRPDPAANTADNRLRPFAGLRRWAHELGKGGHYATKSHRYSTTLGALRAARRHWTTGSGSPTSPAASVDVDRHSSVATEDDQIATVVLADWTYTGSGWRTTGDAALALAAADAARQRRPANLIADPTASSARAA